MLDTTPPPLPPRNAALQIFLWALVANGIGGVLLAVINWFVRAHTQEDISTFVVWPSFFFLPFFVGLLAAWFWRRLNRTIGWSFLDALGLIALGESVYHSEGLAVVTDRIIINAPPAKVWPHVLAFPTIPDPASYWIFRLGLPYPTTTTNGGNFVGADRQCIFSNGVVIKERVAEFVPNEKLTFDVAEQPTDPEAYGHITLHRGQFVLQDNHDGTTTLIGSSWYTLHVRPRWYFDLWTRDMSRAVHLRVMNHIKRLSE